MLLFFNHRKNRFFILLFFFVAFSSSIFAQNQPDEWITDNVIYDGIHLQSITQHKISRNTTPHRQETHLVQITAEETIPVFGLYLFNEDVAYSKIDFSQDKNRYSLQVPEGNYEIIIVYIQLADPVIYSYIFQKITVNQDCSIEILEEEATHNISSKLLNENGIELNDLNYYNAFVFEIKDQLIFLCNASANQKYFVKISDVNSERFQLFNVMMASPAIDKQAAATDNSWYFMMNDPVEKTVNSDLLFINNPNSYTPNDFIFPDIKNEKNPTLSDVYFGINMRPFHIGYQGDARYSTNIVRVYSYRKNFDSHFQFFFQPFCNYAHSFDNQHLNRKMTPGVRSPLFSLNQNALQTNTGLDFYDNLILQPERVDFTMLPTHFTFPSGESAIFNETAPIFYFQHQNSILSNTSVCNFIYPYDMNGAVNEMEYLNSRATLFCNDVQIFSDSLYKWKETTVPNRSVCEFSVKSGTTVFMEKERFSVATLHFDLQKNDAQPPALSMFRILSDKGAISQWIKGRIGARIQFTTGDYFNRDKSIIYQEKSNVEVFYSCEGSDEWNLLEQIEIPEKFDPVSGNFFEVSLAQISDKDWGWINLKIICTDNTKNTMTQELFPAFFLEKYITNIDEIASEKNASIRAYPNPFSESVVVKTDHPICGQAQIAIYSVLGEMVYSKALNCFNNNIFTWDGRKSSGNEATTGIYFYSIKTENETLCVKIIKR